MPKLLFISPVVPNDSGGGPGMRSHMFLKAFQRGYDVHLLVLDRTLQKKVSVSDSVKKECVDVKVISLSNTGTWYHKRLRQIKSPVCRLLFTLLYMYPYEHGFYSKEDVQKMFRIYGDIHFDVVHIYRLWVLPAAMPYMKTVQNKGGRTVLDVDDLESKLHFRSAKMPRTQYMTCT